MEKMFKGMKIDIGAGNPAEGENQAEAGYLLQDVEAHEGIDIVCDIRNLKETIGDNLCSEIRASHVLEHFHMNELKKSILPMLRECLTDDGILNIIVPNFEWHCELVKAGHDEKAVYYSFGGGLDKYDHHYTAWTQRLAYRWLFDAGFEVIELNTDTCIHIKARKQ
jgi:predicted SAM-dependent methyltransferase